MVRFNWRSLALAAVLTQPAWAWAWGEEPTVPPEPAPPPTAEKADPAQPAVGDQPGLDVAGPDAAAPQPQDPGAVFCEQPSCAPPCGSLTGLSCDCRDFGSERLFGLIAPSAAGYDRFISPMINTVFFEDPRTLTEARFIFLNHHLPRALGGGEINLLAMQARAALTDRLSLIATKDGFIFSDSPLVDEGWADVAAGLKYNLFADVETQRLLSAGLTYEIPAGTSRALQGNGDGEFNLFLSGGVEFAKDWHWLSSTGFRLPVNTHDESQVWYWSNHIDRRLGESGLYLFAETNWYHWLQSGGAFALPVEGGDLINLGSRGVAGNDIVTGAIGVKYKLGRNHELGFAYEAPLTERRDVLQHRLTVDLIFRF